MSATYTRAIEGRAEAMIEVAPGEFVNTVSAAKLGLIRTEQKTKAAASEVAT
jgi:hypothetical protein